MLPPSLYMSMVSVVYIINHQPFPNAAHLLLERKSTDKTLGERNPKKVGWENWYVCSL